MIEARYDTIYLLGVAYLDDLARCDGYAPCGDCCRCLDRPVCGACPACLSAKACARTEGVA